VAPNVPRKDNTPTSSFDPFPMLGLIEVSFDADEDDLVVHSVVEVSLV
jgi:hypothetical protein